MFGFVYIWRDKLTGRFYIGSHKGAPDDGYICSSPKMLKEYRSRSQDFKRRLLHICYTNRFDLLDAEQRWLDLIPKEEFGLKYYNRSASAKGMLLVSDEGRRQANQKTAEKNRGRKFPPRSEQWKKNISLGKIGKKPSVPFSDERREKLRVANLGKIHSEETKEKIAQAVRNRFSDPEERRIQAERLTGRKLSKAHCNNISQSLIGKTALGWSAGSSWITNGLTDIQISIGEKIPDGFRMGRREVRATIGKKWINNGTINSLIPKGAEPPVGFTFGKLNYKLRSDTIRNMTHQIPDTFCLG